MVRPLGPSPVIGRFALVTHLPKPQHHDSRDLWRLVHGHAVVSFLSTTSHHSVASEAFDWCTSSHANDDTLDHLEHDLGTVGCRRAGVGHRGRLEPSRDAISLCFSPWFAARS